MPTPARSDYLITIFSIYRVPVQLWLGAISTTTTPGLSAVDCWPTNLTAFRIYLPEFDLLNRPVGEKSTKSFQRTMFRRTAQVVGPIQELPMFESRVALDPEVKDFWGDSGSLPVGRTTPRSTTNTANSSHPKLKIS